MSETAQELAKTLTESLDRALSEFSLSEFLGEHSVEDLRSDDEATRYAAWKMLLDHLTGPQSVVINAFGKFYPADADTDQPAHFEKESEIAPESFALRAINLETRYYEIALLLEVEIDRMKVQAKEGLLDKAGQMHWRVLRAIDVYTQSGIRVLDMRGDVTSDAVIEQAGDGSGNIGREIQTLRENLEWAPQVARRIRHIQQLLEVRDGRLDELIAPDQQQAVRESFIADAEALKVFENMLDEPESTVWTETDLIGLAELIISLQADIRAIEEHEGKPKQVLNVPAPPPTMEPVVVRPDEADVRPVILDGSPDAFEEGTIDAVCSVPGQHWLGHLESNGNREVAIIVPEGTDLTKPVTVMYYFHGLRANIQRCLQGSNEGAGFGPHLGRFAAQDDQNMVFVFPRGHTDPNYKHWMNAQGGESMRTFQDQSEAVLRREFGNGIQVSKRVLVAHSAGGHAIANGVEGSDVQADTIILLDAAYGNWASRTRIAQSETPMMILYTDDTEDGAIAVNGQSGVVVGRVDTAHGQIPAQFFKDELSALPITPVSAQGPPPIMPASFPGRPTVPTPVIEQMPDYTEQKTYLTGLKTFLTSFAPDAVPSEDQKVAITSRLTELKSKQRSGFFNGYEEGISQANGLVGQLEELLERRPEVTDADIIREIYTNGIKRNVPNFLTLSNPRIVNGNLMYTSVVDTKRVPFKLKMAYLGAKDKNAWSASQIKIPIRGFRTVTRNDVSTKGFTTQVTLRPASGYTLERICLKLMGY